MTAVRNVSDICDVKHAFSKNRALLVFHDNVSRKRSFLAIVAITTQLWIIHLVRNIFPKK